MSWRQFLHFAAGLSSASRFYQELVAERRAAAKRKTYGSQEELNQAMDSVYGG